MCRLTAAQRTRLVPLAATATATADGATTVSRPRSSGQTSRRRDHGTDTYMHEDTNTVTVTLSRG